MLTIVFVPFGQQIAPSISCTSLRKCILLIYGHVRRFNRHVLGLVERSLWRRLEKQLLRHMPPREMRLVQRRKPLEQPVMQWPWRTWQITNSVRLRMPFGPPERQWIQACKRRQGTGSVAGSGINSQIRFAASYWTISDSATKSTGLYSTVEHYRGGQSDSRGAEIASGFSQFEINSRHFRPVIARR
jgi:hypothetical protein